MHIYMEGCVSEYIHICIWLQMCCPPVWPVERLLDPVKSSMNGKEKHDSENVK